MTRLRATLSTSPVDKAIADKVSDAQRSLQAALRLCDSRRETDPLVRRRMAATRRDIEQALGAMSSVRRVTPLFDQTDPDLTDVPSPPPRRKPEPPATAPSPEE